MNVTLDASSTQTTIEYKRGKSEQERWLRSDYEQTRVTKRNMNRNIRRSQNPSCLEPRAQEQIVELPMKAIVNPEPE